MSFPNRYPGTCSVCAAPVTVGEGLAYKDGGWKTVCASSQCQARALGAAEVPSTERKLLADGTLLCPFDRDALPLIKGMPGARWSKDRRVWTVSTRPADRIRVLEVAARLALDVAPELQVAVADDVTDAAVARAQAGGAYPYQVDGVRWLATHARALLGDDMGLGKTAQSLWALPGRAVVVCPKSLKLNWRNEIKRWRPDLTPIVLSGKGSMRAPAAGEVVIVNFDVLAEDAAAGLDLADCTLLIDEAHRCKSHKAKRTKAVGSLRDACARCWILTGTPLLGRPFDLWGVLQAGGMGAEVFGGFGGFLRCFGGSKNKWGGFEFDGPDASVPERLRRVMIRRTKTEVLPDLPARTRSKMIVNDLPDALRRELDRAYNDWYGLDFEGKAQDQSALPDFREFSDLRAKLAASRITAAIDWCEDREEEGAPVLVFSAHRAPVEALGAREGWGMILGGTSEEERQALVEKFQRGELKGLALTITAGGVGITLTRASTALFVDLDWTPGNNLQAEDRMIRIGQTATSVQIVRMVSDHVLDAHVLELLDQKMRLIEAAVERVAVYVPRAVTTTTIEETPEQWQARIDAQQAVARDMDASGEHRSAAASIRRRLAGARATDAKIPESFTAEQGDALRGAVTLLAEVCDGAHDKDGAGFNKPDASAGHWLALVGMESTECLQLAWIITRKYARQCAALFPVAFPTATKRAAKAAKADA